VCPYCVTTLSSTAHPELDFPAAATVKGREKPFQLWGTYSRTPRVRKNLKTFFSPANIANKSAADNEYVGFHDALPGFSGLGDGEAKLTHPTPRSVIQTLLDQRLNFSPIAVSPIKPKASPLDFAAAFCVCFIFNSQFVLISSGAGQ
jgi:hypothetical protein